MSTTGGQKPFGSVSSSERHRLVDGDPVAAALVVVARLA
jgi:hypothetical protein